MARFRRYEIIVKVPKPVYNVYVDIAVLILAAVQKEIDNISCVAQNANMKEVIPSVNDR